MSKEIILETGADDYHVHLRQSKLMDFVVSQIYSSGVRRVLVMPNTNPPLTTVPQISEYYQLLKDLDPRIDYYMTLYLTPNISLNDLTEIHHWNTLRKKANQDGIIVGIKYYPKASKTTFSHFGVDDLIKDISSEIFEKMIEYNLVLNLHGEAEECNQSIMHNEPRACFIYSDSTLNSEQNFLPTLITLLKQYPKLKIVFEHISDAKTVDLILQSSTSNIAATITPHHLLLMVDDVLGNPFHYCKPVIKSNFDKESLWRVIESGDKRFFLGSDSAPHCMIQKLNSVIPCSQARKEKSFTLSSQDNPIPLAGIFHYPYLLPILATAFEKRNCLHQLIPFISQFGRQWYQLEPSSNTNSSSQYQDSIRLIKQESIIPASVSYHHANDSATISFTIIPFMANQSIPWSVLIKS